jgi:O-antigen ligase
MLIGWVLRGTGDWRLGRATAITLSLVGFWLWTLVGALFAPNQEVAWSVFEDLSKIVLPFLVGITTIESVKMLKQLAWVIVLSEGYLSYEFNMSYLSGFNMAMEGFGSMGRAVVGVGLVCCFGLALFLMLSSAAGWQKALAVLCAMLIGHAIILTFSRGALLGLIVCVLISFLCIKKRPIHYVAFALVVIIGLMMAGREVRERFGTAFAEESEREASAQSRLDLWDNCLTLIREKPVLGIGPGHFSLVSDRFGWGKGKEAHSLWLQVAAEAGLPALAMLALFYSLPLWQLWAPLRALPNNTNATYQTIAGMVWAGLSGFVVAAFFVTVEGLEIPYYVVLVGSGALKLQSRQPAELLVPSRSFSFRPRSKVRNQEVLAAVRQRSRGSKLY